MRAHLRWEGGGEAEIVAITEGAIEVVSTVPKPPGSRIDGALVEAPAATLKMKVHGSKLRDDGAYALVGRPLNMTRELRERLAALLGPA